MNEQDGLDELIRALFVGETRAEEGVHPPAVGAAAQQAAAIAQSRRLIQALGAVSTVLTGEASMIDGAAAAYMTCEECIAELPGYVEAWLAGEALEKRYSALHRHLRACPNCQEQALALRTLLQSAATSAPTYPTFAQLRQQLAAQPATALWQRTAEQIYQLAGEITLILTGTKAAFGELAAGLTPQLVPATALRGGAAETLTEVLELPHPESDLLIKVRMGAVHDGLGALALQFVALAASESLADVKVTLRDEDGSLLESTRSDQDGLALFDDLETGKYQLQIERADQNWLVGITIRG